MPTATASQPVLRPHSTAPLPYPSNTAPESPLQRHYVWCLECDRVYQCGEFRWHGNLQICPYPDCQAEVRYALAWTELRESMEDDARYPEIPEENVRYPVCPESTRHRSGITRVFLFLLKLPFILLSLVACYWSLLALFGGNWGRFVGWALLGFALWPSILWAVFTGIFEGLFESESNSTTRRIEHDSPPATVRTMVPETPKHVYCRYCGTKASKISSLTASTCYRHPHGAHKHKHAPYEGSEKTRYECKFCGTPASSIASLTASSCYRHPKGAHKGGHEPAM